ncbi:hypothetical protein EHS25_005681 [Saitozyma podzolica]|uniref:Uncharacterized protein n=1 Tax=Saitozyma podzolica TaxID=1890683 RepID=A0A427XVW3_9TREE|nr:hypothetical protein EHS25_005681 [Saitozyma podzolica]
MSLALPASIEISAEPLISQDIKPSGARASWEVWRIDDKVDDEPHNRCDAGEQDIRGR